MQRTFRKRVIMFQMDINWPLGTKKKLLYSPELRVNVFAQRTTTKIRSRFHSHVHMFKIIMERSQRKIKKQYLLKDHNSSFIRLILKSMYGLLLKAYKTERNHIYFQIDISMKGNLIMSEQD